MVTIEDKKTYDKVSFLERGVSKSLIGFNVFLAIIYFLAILFWFDQGNKVMFWLLVAGEVFHMWQLFTYLYTVWDMDYVAPSSDAFKPPVDVFITVAGEPVDIVEETLLAAIAMDYPDFKVHILNDGYVAKKDNWQEIEAMAKLNGVNCITRKVAGGAKAGNINNALRETDNPYVAVFDADHVPHRDFLAKTMGYFVDRDMGYVQSPQYYKNHDENDVTQGAWEQQALFFGAICRGKNRLNAVTMCGTNMVISREALDEVGGIQESIAEDFITGVFIHQNGWKSTYVPEVLAEGLAPEDFMSYFKQQFRWARGALDVAFDMRIWFGRGLSFVQKIQYLSSVSYFVSGTIVLMNALIPVVYFFTGIVPLQISTMTLAAIFIPYIILTIYTLQVSSNFSYSFRSLAFSMAGFNIHVGALWAKIIGRKTPFAITSKKKVEGNFIRLVIPQIIYVVLVLVGIVIGVLREGLSPSFLSNFAWVVLNVVVFGEFISAAMPQRKLAGRELAESREELAPEADDELETVRESA